MRIESINVTSLASLQGQQPPIDLATGELGEAGLVAVTGPTGAGKSTLFDAVCLALYDQTPRLGKATRELLSRGAGQAQVEVVVRIDAANRWLARWSVRRARGRPDGQLQSVDHEVYDADNPGTCLAAGKREVQALVADKLGLSFDQFRAVVMLSQGDFARFLHESGDAKAQLLEKLTNTGIYSQLGQAAHERAQAATSRITELRLGLEAVVVWSAEERQAAEQQLEALGKALATAGERVAAAQRLHDWWAKERDLGQRLATSDVDLAQVRREHDAAQPRRERVQAARRAQEAEAAAAERLAATRAHANATEGQRAAVSRQREARARVEQATQDLAEALARGVALAEGVSQALAASSTDRHLDAARLRRFEDGLAQMEQADREGKRHAASLQAAEKDRAQAQAALATLAERHAAAQEALEAARRQEATAREQQAAAGDPAQLAERLAIVRQASALAQAQAQDAVALTGARDRTATARSEEERAVAVAEAAAAEAATAAEAVEAQERAVDALQASASIGHFVEYLVADEPCPLCGSVAHPSPADPEAGDARLVEAETLLKQQRQAARRAAKGADKAKDAVNRATSARAAAAARVTAMEDRATEALEQWRQLREREPTLAEVPGQPQALQALAEALTADQARLTACTRAAQRARASLERCQTALNEVGTTYAKAVAEAEAATARCEERHQALQASRKQASTVRRSVEKVAASLAQDLETEVPSIDEDPDALSQWLSELQDRAEARRTLQGLASDVDDLAREGFDRYRAQLPAGSTLPPVPEPVLSEVALREVRALLRRAAERYEGHRATAAAAAAALDDAVAAEQAARAAKDEQERVFVARVQELGFDAVADWRAARLPMEQLEALEGELDRLEERLSRCTGARAALVDQHQDHRRQGAMTGIAAELLAALASPEPDPGLVGNQLTLSAEALHAARAEEAAQREALGRVRAERAQDEANRERYRAAQEAIAAAEAEADVWRRLNEVMGSHDGKRFRLVAQQMTLDQLLLLANRRLDVIAPRYHLARTVVANPDDTTRSENKALDLVVIDRHQADERRPVATLSGGETFLVSLALALALADLKRGSLHIGTLFIDEGFGTLDAETLETSMQVLTRLQAEQDTQILLISHVPAIRQRLQHRITVEKRGAGRSRLRLYGPDGPVSVEQGAVASPTGGQVGADDTDADPFLNALDRLGGTASATALRRSLGWSVERFKAARGLLERAGRIATPPGTRTIERCGSPVDEGLAPQRVDG